MKRKGPPAFAVAIAFAAIAGTGHAQNFHPDIPKAWDEASPSRKSPSEKWENTSVG